MTDIFFPIQVWVFTGMRFSLLRKFGILIFWLWYRVW